MNVPAFSEIEKGHAEIAPPPSAQGVPTWYPPPSYPPPRVKAQGTTDGRAIASLIAAIAGIVLGLPMGIPGMVLGTLAYFLGKSAMARIDSSQGALGGRSVAVTGWVFGIVAMAIGSAVSLIWIVVVLVATAQPSTGG
ncbi:MAG: hypothetical protein ACYDA0_04010 [Candidatus Dormibacteraceae bacterium]